MSTDAPRRVPLRWRAGAAATLAVLFVPTGGCKEATPEPATEVEQREPVQLAPVERGAIDVTVRAAGVLAPRREADLSFKVSGVATRVLVDTGKRVRKGDRLAQLDPVELGAALQQARDALAQAQRELDRITSLHAQGTAPRAALEAAQTQVALLRSRSSTAARAVQYATLLAPDDGVIERRMIEVGEHVEAGAPVFRIDVRAQGQVARFELTDAEVLGVKIGDRTSVTLDARPSLSYAGHVSQIATAATPGTATFTVEATIDEPGALELPSGLTVKIDLTHREELGITVPADALVDGLGAEAAVWVVQGEGVRRVAVRVRFVHAGRAIIESGLDGIDEVVGAGAMLLNDKSRVAVLPNRAKS